MVITSPPPVGFEPSELSSPEDFYGRKNRKKAGDLLSTGLENTMPSIILPLVAMPGIANQSLLFLEPATAEPFKHGAMGHYSPSAGPSTL